MYKKHMAQSAPHNMETITISYLVTRKDGPPFVALSQDILGCLFSICFTFKPLSLVLVFQKFSAISHLLVTPHLYSVPVMIFFSLSFSYLKNRTTVCCGQ